MVDELVQGVEDGFEGVERVLVVGIGGVLVHEGNEKFLGTLGPNISTLERGLAKSSKQEQGASKDLPGPIQQ